MDSGQAKFSENTKKIRKERSLTQGELAEMADLSIDVIKNLEGGRRGGSVPTFMAIAKALEMSIEQIMEYGSSSSKGPEIDAELLQKLATLGPRELDIVTNTVNTLYDLAQQANHLKDEKPRKTSGQ